MEPPSKWARYRSGIESRKGATARSAARLTGGHGEIGGATHRSSGIVPQSGTEQALCGFRPCPRSEHTDAPSCLHGVRSGLRDLVSASTLSDPANRFERSRPCHCAAARVARSGVLRATNGRCTRKRVPAPSGRSAIGTMGVHRTSSADAFWVPAGNSSHGKIGCARPGLVAEHSYRRRDAAASGARRARVTAMADGAPAMNHAAITASKMQHPKEDVSMSGQMGFPKK